MKIFDYLRFSVPCGSRMGIRPDSLARNGTTETQIINYQNPTTMKKLLYSGFTTLMMLLAFMGVGKAQTVTFSPAAGTVEANQEITINYSGNATVYYTLYSSMTEAQNDPAFNGTGNDDDFYDAYGNTLIDYGTTHPIITTGKTVIRVGLHDDGWVKTDIYAEYILAGGETPEPPTTPAVPLTFKPGTGTEDAQFFRRDYFPNAIYDLIKFALI